MDMANEIANFRYGLERYPKAFKSPVAVNWRMTLNTPWATEQDSDLPVEKLLDIAKQIVDCDVVDVSICGGEPMLKKELLFQILDMFYKNSIITSLKTSGYALDEKCITFFKEKKIQIRMEMNGTNAGMHEPVFGYEGTFELASNTISKISKILDWLIVEVHVVKSNYMHLSDIIDYIVNSLGAKNLEFIFYDFGKDFNKDNYLGFQERQMVMEEIVKKQEEYNNQKTFRINDPTLILRRAVRSQAPSTEAAILSNGNVRLNEWIPIEYGSLKEQRLEEIWSKMTDAWGQEDLQKMINRMRNVTELSNKV